MVVKKLVRPLVANRAYRLQEMTSRAVDMLAVDRGGVREATHAGHLAVVEASGSLVASLGDPERVTYYRSCAKPFQALAGLGTGIVDRFHLEPAHIAVMSASHSGEPNHVDTVRDLLRRSAIPEEALQCGAHWPLHEPSAEAARREYEKPIAVFNNCSGKHAGMLAAAKALGAPVDSYLDRQHPVQVRIREVVAEFTGCDPATMRFGTDGCSAPNAAVPLRAIAHSLARLGTSASPAAKQVVEAMTANPYVVGGTDRFDTRLMEVSGGRILAKGGAAGLQVVLDRRSGQGLALKLESGDGAYIAAAVLRAMAGLGWLDEGEEQALASFGRPKLRNHRRIEVGEVEPVFEVRL